MTPAGPTVGVSGQRGVSGSPTQDSPLRALGTAQMQLIAHSSKACEVYLQQERDRTFANGRTCSHSFTTVWVWTERG